MIDEFKKIYPNYDHKMSTNDTIKNVNNPKNGENIHIIILTIIKAM